jgi:serine/threonine-protein kinase
MPAAAADEMGTDTPTTVDDTRPDNPAPSFGPQGLSRRYQILGSIASGGMASVHLGRQVERDGTSRTIAVKVMHPYLAGDPEMVAMFLDEARLSTKIHHPHVVAVSDVDMVGNDLVIVMEYVPGMNLLALQRALKKASGARLPVRVALRVMLDVLAGLHAAHELRDEHGRPLNIVHRDVSPHNVLIGLDGNAKIMDFGVATAAGRLAQTQADGTVKGKLRYLSPEQLHRKPLDRRVDVFSAGIVLWEALTGESLFGTGTEAETLGRVLRHPIAPPSTHEPAVSLALDEVCLKALERDRDRRYATALDLAQAIEKAAAGEVASRQEVAALVRSLAAEEMARHEEALAAAPMTSRPAATALAALGDTESGVSQDPPRARSGGSRMLVVAAISLALGGAAVWALGLVQSRPRVDSPPPAAPTLTAPASAAAATPPTTPPAIEIFEPSASSSSAPTASVVPAPKRGGTLDTGARGATTGARRQPASTPSAQKPFMPSEL